MHWLAHINTNFIADNNTRPAFNRVAQTNGYRGLTTLLALNLERVGFAMTSGFQLEIELVSFLVTALEAALAQLFAANGPLKQLAHR